MARLIAFFASIVLMSGCAHTDKIQRERDRALERTKQFTFYPVQQLLEYTSSLLTRNIAVSLALQKNSSLQASFDKLGIARADLEKAGVFTNPYLDAIFAIPTDKVSTTALTFYVGILKVSDLWLVPIKRKIAERELEIVSWEATTQALKTIRDTQLAYNACIQANLRSQAAHNYERALHNIPRDLDYKIKTEHIKHEAQSKKARSHLQRLMGSSLSPHVAFEDTLAIPTIHDIEAIKASITATQLMQHPTMVINQIRIERARHQLSYEQGRCMEDTTFGYNYVNWFDGTAGSGPFFHMSFPIGDTTHAGQMRARAVITQYEREAEAALQLMQQEAEKFFIELTSIFEQLELTKNELLPYLESQLQHRNNVFDENQGGDDRKELVEIITNKYDAEKLYIDLLISYHKALIRLDYVVGGGILKTMYHKGL